MVKRSKQSSQRKNLQAQLQAASNEPEFRPDATFGPEALIEATGVNLIETDSTNAPVIAQDQEGVGYSTSGYELFDRFLQGRMIFRPRSLFLILTLGWFGFISWMFLQDNQLDRLTTIDGMKWFGVKASIYSAFYILVAVIIWLSSLIRSNE